MRSSGVDASSEAPFVSNAPRVISPWNGTHDVYRNGVFTTQHTRLWCTAACIQMMLNITLNEEDHSRASQAQYIRYAREHDLYAPRQAKGSDPRGWASALSHFEGGSGHRDVTSTTFDEAVQRAARRLRITGKPVGLLVMKGDHAWVMTGFSADADPATSHDFSVTHVMVTGPLYPIQQDRGYDMPPDTTLEIDRLRAYFGPYFDKVNPSNPWQGLHVAIEP